MKYRKRQDLPKNQTEQHPLEETIVYKNMIRSLDKYETQATTVKNYKFEQLRISPELPLLKE